MKGGKDRKWYEFHDKNIGHSISPRKLAFAIPQIFAVIFSHCDDKSEPVERLPQTSYHTGIHQSPHRQDWLPAIFTHHSEKIFISITRIQNTLDV